MGQATESSSFLQMLESIQLFLKKISTFFFFFFGFFGLFVGF